MSGRAGEARAGGARKTTWACRVQLWWGPQVGAGHGKQQETSYMRSYASGHVRGLLKGLFIVAV